MGGFGPVVKLVPGSGRIGDPIFDGGEYIGRIVDAFRYGYVLVQVGGLPAGAFDALVVGRVAKWRECHVDTAAQFWNLKFLEWAGKVSL